MGLALFFIFLAVGCATTGRGEFPAFKYKTPGKQTLAVVPPLGYASNDLRSTILSHLNRKTLEKKFKSIKFVDQETVKSVLGENYSGERVSRKQGRKLAETTGADLILGFWIHDYVVERFSTTETQTLYTTNTEYRNTSVYSDETEESDRGEHPGKGKARGKNKSKKNESENTYISTMETKTKTREIPISEAQNRVVLSLTALVYNVDREQVIWKGKRIERAEAPVRDRSVVELTDIASERIMSRVNNKFRE